MFTDLAGSMRLGCIDASVGVTLLEAPKEHLNTSSKAGFLAAYIRLQTRAEAFATKLWLWGLVGMVTDNLRLSLTNKNWRSNY